MNKKGWIPEPLFTQIKKLAPIPCVDLLIIHNGRLLLMLRNNEPGKDLWFTPGGRVLKNESLIDACSRILTKETGLEAEKIIQVGTMSHFWPDVHTITTYYLVYVETEDVKLNEEHRDYKWINETSSDLHPYIIEMIKNSGVLE